MERPSPFRFAPRCFPLGRRDAPDALLARLEGRVARPCLLDSAGGSPCSASVLAFDPLPLPAPRSLGELRGLSRRLVRGQGDPVAGFFQGGFLGALAYEGGERLTPRPLPADPLGLPPVAGGFYVDFLVREEPGGEWVLVLGADPGDARASVGERHARVREFLARDVPRGAVVFEGELVRHVSPERHRARIEAVRRRIAEGEVYQANVTQRFSRALRGSPVELYRRLRALQPTPYAGYLELEGGALLSASPELLLDYDRREARTRPIKGTSPRRRDPEGDAASARALLQSEKDLAELGMIVDLERNDLGRVAETGSVEVRGFPTLESYPSVHHLAADVSARARAGVDGLDVLASLFPGGSITGAPKRRCVELLAEIEGEGRGFFYGSLFSHDTRGRTVANLLIRTLVWRDSVGAGPPRVHYRTGGGITWSSDAGEEERECSWKGEALARVLGQQESSARPLLLPS